MDLDISLISIPDESQPLTPSGSKLNQVSRGVFSERSLSESVTSEPWSFKKFHRMEGLGQYDFSPLSVPHYTARRQGPDVFSRLVNDVNRRNKVKLKLKQLGKDDQSTNFSEATKDTPIHHHEINQLLPVKIKPTYKITQKKADQIAQRLIKAGESLKADLEMQRLMKNEIEVQKAKDLANKYHPQRKQNPNVVSRLLQPKEIRDVQIKSERLLSQVQSQELIDRLTSKTPTSPRCGQQRRSVKTKLSPRRVDKLVQRLYKSQRGSPREKLNSGRLLSIEEVIQNMLNGKTSGIPQSSVDDIDDYLMQLKVKAKPARITDIKEMRKKLEIPTVLETYNALLNN